MTFSSGDVLIGRRAHAAAPGERIFTRRQGSIDPKRRPSRRSSLLAMPVGAPASGIATAGRADPAGRLDRAAHCAQESADRGGAEVAYRRGRGKPRRKKYKRRQNKG